MSRDVHRPIEEDKTDDRKGNHNHSRRGLAAFIELAPKGTPISEILAARDSGRKPSEVWGDDG